MHQRHRSTFDLLCLYAAVHRDQRNIQTHLVGVPMVVFAIGLLLARPAFTLAGWPLTPAWAAFALAAAWYLTRGLHGLGTATAVGVGALVALAHHLSAGGTLLWLTAGVGLFFAGGIVQFLGHYYEGRRRALADDLVGLLVSPMFVTLELCHLAGAFRGLMAEVEARVGPRHLRDLAHPAA